MVEQSFLRRRDMRELSLLERWLTAVAAVFSILGVLASFAIMAGLLPQPSESREGPPQPEATAPTDATPVEKVKATPIEPGPSPTPEMTETTRRPEIPKTPEFPVQARLEDGQQHVMLEGDLGVSIAFSEVASTPIATLRINHEGDQEVKALLGAGDVFTVEVRGARYRISVLLLSFETREIQVQIDRVDG
jgi:hypothetical protein